MSTDFSIPSPQPILKVIDLYKSFGEKKVHQGVTFNLNQSECLGVLGGSGTGKSVLMRTIIGLERADSGEIYFKNDRIDVLTEEEFIPYRIQISYSFQNGALFDSMSVFDNLAFPLKEHTTLSREAIQNKCRDILHSVNLFDVEHLFPSDLSGGMQKRVGMIRSMILNPKIILFDEPTAGLDPANTLNVVQIMKKSKLEKMSSIFITHDITAALQVCDRLIILHEGKVIFNNTPLNFLKSEDPRILPFKATLDPNMTR
jgi:phospholipid/cholesterol/gamma-HCH transport system ATP-binding protein